MRRTYLGCTRRPAAERSEGALPVYYKYTQRGETMEKIILASKSPRRQEILSLGGYEYEVCVSSAEEQIPPEELENLTPQELVERLARVKAEDVYRRNCNKNTEESTTNDQAADSVKLPGENTGQVSGDMEEEITVIGADTVVAVDGRVLGKPRTEEEAYVMLSMLEGRTHDVFTGVCILWASPDTPAEIQGNIFHCHTKVTFYPMTEEEIANYVATGDCMDKAGAYGIQSGAAKYIQGIEGDYLNVVGLPLSKIYHVLSEKITNLTIKR